MISPWAEYPSRSAKRQAFSRLLTCARERRRSRAAPTRRGIKAFSTSIGRRSASEQSWRHERTFRPRAAGGAETCPTACVIHHGHVIVVRLVADRLRQRCGRRKTCEQRWRKYRIECFPFSPGARRPRLREPKRPWTPSGLARRRETMAARGVRGPTLLAPELPRARRCAAPRSATVDGPSRHRPRRSASPWDARVASEKPLCSRGTVARFLAKYSATKIHEGFLVE